MLIYLCTLFFFLLLFFVLSFLLHLFFLFIFFFFNDTATTEIYTLSLHDALPISRASVSLARMSPSFAEIAPRYDTLRPLSSGDRQRLERMLGAAALSVDDLVVDVGCGTGRMTLPLAAMTPARVIGVDPESRMLEVARA